jgi:hypothetical protein
MRAFLSYMDASSSTRRDVQGDRVISSWIGPAREKAVAEEEEEEEEMGWKEENEEDAVVEEEEVVVVVVEDEEEEEDAEAEAEEVAEEDDEKEEEEEEEADEPWLLLPRQLPWLLDGVSIWSDRLERDGLSGLLGRIIMRGAPHGVMSSMGVRLCPPNAPLSGGQQPLAAALAGPGPPPPAPLPPVVCTERDAEDAEVAEA